MQKFKGKILWVDDEIDHLKPHILFLEEKGYSITGITNAEDALVLVEKEQFDLVLLDEMMNGMDGLQALEKLHEIKPALPVIMVTKSEQEDIMEKAIGGNIEDYLTKPVNPSQILSSCKKILEKKRIDRDRLTRDYTSEFSEISRLLCQTLTASDWIDIHLKLSEREIKLDKHLDLGLKNTLKIQRQECNIEFGHFIEANYYNWLHNAADQPLLSPDIIRETVMPLLKEDNQVLFVVIDNLRFDQWLAIEPILYDFFNIDRRAYYSILPTATPYSRNAIFSGLMPLEIQKKYPDLWQRSETDEFSKNRFESQFLKDQLQRLGLGTGKTTKYIKVLNAEDAGKLARNSSDYLNFDMTAIVFNFVDMVAHKRSESEILKEIVPDESAYRSLTRSWFEHSALLQILQTAAQNGRKVVITSDHGSIRVKKATTVHADRHASSSLRYKYGRNLKAESKYTLNIKNPEEYLLPPGPMNTNFLIAKEETYFVYPTNYHHFLNLYKDSLQHGGISLEEMILPLCILDPTRNRIQ